MSMKLGLRVLKECQRLRLPLLREGRPSCMVARLKLGQIKKNGFRGEYGRKAET
jgi:hypothetical protein